MKVLLSVIAVALLAGCSKLTVENYNRLKVGMSYEEVTAILGDPARCDEAVGVRVCTWGDERRRINVNFLAGKVLLLGAENIK